MSRKASLMVLAFSLVVAVSLTASMVWHHSPGDADGPVKQMGIMVEVYQHISDDYVTTPNLGKVSNGALHGLLESLDADSSYLGPQEYQAYLAQQAHPPAGGVEAVLSKRVGYADVVDVQAGGNAAQAGLVRGDFVEAIGNTDTRDMSMEAIDRRLRGAPGSTITLSVVHLHRSNPVKVTITRVAASMPALQSRKQGSVGIIRVPDFEAGRAGQVAAAVKALRGQGARQFVLDLRNCGAGSYAEAEQTANVFLNQGTITYLKGQKYPQVTTTAEAAKAVDPSDKLEVLVNFGTFGPAEVAAAALQQNGRAQVIGDPSFGEGSLQKLIPVGDGSALWLTVARYYSPKGKLIQDGITPDVAQVKYEGALPDLDYAPEGVTGQQPDLQMQKALQLAAAGSTP
ncbi:MAG TPA: S41 family peptidase [Terriglobales bacterium]|nr:S41 family peptidase [Terriglobales bacterium]